MRGPDEQTSARFSDLSPEPRVRAAPPLRAIRRRPDEAVATLSPRLAAMDSAIGRPSIPPEPLRRAWLRPALYPVRREARAAGLLSDEHVTVARTQLDAWASLKSVQRPEAPRPPPDDPGNPTVHVHGARRSQATPRSTTAPDVQRVRQGGAGAVRSALGHVVLDHRHGLVVTPCVTAATGAAASAGYAARG